MSTEEDLLTMLRDRLPKDKVREVNITKWLNKFEIITDPENIRYVILALKGLGFNHLVAIETIDWLKKEPTFELIYYLASIERNGAMVLVRTKIPRDNPVIDSIHDILPFAYYQELENYEFFGITFRGHKGLKLWILEDNWDGPPPLRKDFDSVKYALEHYYKGLRYERGDSDE